MTEHAAATQSGLHIVAQHVALLQQHGLDTLEALCDSDLGEALTKPGLANWRERIRIELDAPGGPKTLFLKRFRPPPAARRRAIRASGLKVRSMAEIEWAWMHALADDGIPAVRPVALGAALNGKRESCSLILAEAVPGRSLEQWSKTWIADSTRFPRSLLATTSALVARFHACGYVHRDLYLAHLFFDPDAPTEDALHLIDLQRVMKPRWRQRRWIVKDIASLNYSTPRALVSQTDRMRWLKTYLGADRIDAEAKRFVRLVVAKSRQIGRHDRRRSRRLAKGLESS